MSKHEDSESVLQRRGFSVTEFAYAFGLSRQHLDTLMCRGDGPVYFWAGHKRVIPFEEARDWPNREMEKTAARRKKDAEAKAKLQGKKDPKD